MHLIYGQPLHPVNPLPVQLRAPQRSQASVPTPLPHVERSVATAPQEGLKASGVLTNGSTPAPSKTQTPHVNAVAGPSKRPASPRPLLEPPKKKVKEHSTAPCVVCGRWPHHLLKACPAVAEGASR